METDLRLGMDAPAQSDRLREHRLGLGEQVNDVGHGECLPFRRDCNGHIEELR